MTGDREAFGQDRHLALVERLGRWSARRRVQRRVGSLVGKRVGDFGSGYEATLIRDEIDVLEHATLIDFQLADDLKAHPKVTAIEGELPGALASLDDESLDVVVCVSILEHLWNDLGFLEDCRRVLAPGGLLYVHVPSWRGKVLLEICAFRFGWSTDEMNDHKRYYDPRELWPLLRSAGFLPHAITCKHHQFGCATFGACRV
jgi:SAM-dependent methyltransferase